jgi:hypothetical protein
VERDEALRTEEISWGTAETRLGTQRKMNDVVLDVNPPGFI